MNVLIFKFIIVCIDCFKLFQTISNKNKTCNGPGSQSESENRTWHHALTTRKKSGTFNGFINLVIGWYLSSMFTIFHCSNDLFYYPFKKYVEYIFSPGCLSIMSHSILTLWLAARTIASFVFVGDCLKQFKTINTNNHKLEWLTHSFSTFLFWSSLLKYQL